MANDEEGFAAHWKRVIQGRMSGAHPLSDTCVRACTMSLISRLHREQHPQDVHSRLELWANPCSMPRPRRVILTYGIAKEAAIDLLGRHAKDLERLAPLMSLFFQQAIALQTDELPEHNPALVIRCSW